MTNPSGFKRLLAAFATASVMLTGGAAQAAAEPVGTVTHLSGILTVKHPDGSVKILSVKSSIIEGDTLSTESEAYARIKFIDSSEVVIRPNTVLKISAVSYKENDPKNDKLALDMVKGGLRAVSGLIGKRNKEAVSYGTPTATIGIRGTHLGALFCQNDCGGVPTPTGKTPDNGLHVDVASGAVVVTPKPVLLALQGGVPLPPGIPPAAPGTNPGSGAGAPGGAPGSGPGGPVQAPPGAGTPPPATVLNAGQFGYLPPPQNGTQPPLVLVPPSQAVQVRMPSSISQNAPAGGAAGKGSDPECVVQ